NSRCYAISVERKRNTSSPLCRIDSSVSDLFGRAIDGIAGAGAMVDDAARPGIDEEEHHRLFELLLRAATASRMRDEDFSRQQEIAATLTDDDFSDRAAVARGAPLLHRAPSATIGRALGSSGEARHDRSALTRTEDGSLGEVPMVRILLPPAESPCKPD